MTKLANPHQAIAEELVKTRKSAPSLYWFEVINDFILNLVEMFESVTPNFDQEAFLEICEMEEKWEEALSIRVQLTHKEAELVEVSLHDLLNSEEMSLTKAERHDAQVIMTKINKGLQI